MTHKKSSFWRFLFSLIPGAGEMYMGFLKMGTSLMALFILRSEERRVGKECRL